MEVLFGLALAIGVLILDGYLIIRYAADIFIPMDNKKIYFSPAVFWTTNGLTLLTIFIWWFLMAMGDFGTYGECIEHIYWWKKVGIACLSVSTAICLLPNFYNLYEHAMDGSKVLLPYSFMALGISCLIYFLINIALNNYIGESVFVFLVSLVIFIFILLYFMPYDANRIQRLNKKLLKKINNINKQINRAVSEIEEFRFKNITIRKYNKTRRSINKVLSKKNIYQTFQPKFKEDTSILKIIKLMDSVSDSKLVHSYNKHKMLFYKENAFKLLEKAKRKDTVYSCDVALRNFSELLKGTVENNNLEIKNIDFFARNIALYEKYNIKFKEISIKNKLILCNILVFIIVVCLATGNLVLKLNQEKIVAESYGKDIPGYELIDKKEIWDDKELYAEIKNDKLRYYSYDHAGERGMVRTHNEGIFEDSQEYYKGDKLSKWKNLKTIESVDEGQREKSLYFWVRGLIGLRKDGRILLSNVEKKWFDTSRYDLYVGLYYNESTGKYFGLKADGELVQINKK